MTSSCLSVSPAEDTDKARSPDLHGKPPMDARSKSVVKRIESLELAIRKAREYLESGEDANWSGFRPLFVSKRRDGKELPPDRDWVKNTFLPRMEKALSRTEKTFERLSLANKSSNLPRD